MFKSLVCGSNFGEREEEDDKPRVVRRKRKHVFFRLRKDRNIENPYSSYGLDKFSSLVADLQEKREKISSKNRGMALVRFVHTNRDALVPVAVKGRSGNNQEEAKGDDSASDKHVILTDRSTSSEPSCGATEEVEEVETPVDRSKKASFMSGEAEPSSYAAAAAVVILILILLAFFGRPVVILWSSIAWYAVPALRGDQIEFDESNRNSTRTEGRARSRFRPKLLAPIFYPVHPSHPESTTSRSFLLKDPML